MCLKLRSKLCRRRLNINQVNDTPRQRGHSPQPTQRDQSNSTQIVSTMPSQLSLNRTKHTSPIVFQNTPAKPPRLISKIAPTRLSPIEFQNALTKSIQLNATPLQRGQSKVPTHRTSETWPIESQGFCSEPNSIQSHTAPAKLN